MEPDVWDSAVASWVALLGSPPQRYEIIRHKRSNLEAAIRGLWAVVQELFPREWSVYRRDDGSYPDPVSLRPHGYIWGVIRNIGPPSLAGAWLRLLQIRQGTCDEYSPLLGSGDVPYVVESDAPDVEPAVAVQVRIPLLATMPDDVRKMLAAYGVSIDELERYADMKRKQQEAQSSEPSTNFRTRVVNLE